MRQIKRIKIGEVYRIKKDNEEYVGILLEKINNIKNQSTFLVFYTTFNAIEEFYEEDALYYKDLTIDKEIISLLKEYYEETLAFGNIMKEISKLQRQRGEIWEQQNKIGNRLVEITGVDKGNKLEEFYRLADTKEDSNFKIAMDNIKITTDNVRGTKEYKSIHQRLSDGFDKMWDFIDRKYI